MNKEYIKNITYFAELEKALNDWFTTFKWNVDISGESLPSLASLSKFTYSVDWDFECQKNNLTSLEWCPTSVGGNFWCYTNNLTTLEWCPQSVKWRFWCQNNEFIPLEEKKKWKVFKLWDSIYIGSPNSKDLQILIKWGEFWIDIESQNYYRSFSNFTMSTVKLGKKILLIPT
jgi:hypothetical protein